MPGRGIPQSDNFDPIEIFELLNTVRLDLVALFLLRVSLLTAVCGQRCAGGQEEKKTNK